MDRQRSRKNTNSIGKFFKMMNQLITNCAIFKGLSESEVVELLEDCIELEIETGQTIVRQNIIEEYVFIITEGSARLLAEDELN